MLKKLTIKNLILVEFAEIDFSDGLNIITGESGSGKSALLSAISLISGRKANPQMIREGEKIGWAEAIFTLSDNEEIRLLLERENIPFTSDNHLSIRREISSSGKSRSFVQDEMVTLPFLKELGNHLLQIADQNSHEELGSEIYQRRLLDTYANLLSDVREFSHLFQREKELLQKKLEHEQKGEKERLLEELKEIEAANIKEGEEEKISNEHHLLVHASEATSKIEAVYSTLKDPILSRLIKLQPLLQQLSTIHKRFEEGLNLLQNARLELEEITHQLLQAKGAFDADPGRIVALEERLQVIDSLKKKHGDQIWEKKEALQKRVKELYASEDEFIELPEIQKKKEKLLQHIKHIRETIASELQEKISSELKSLNLSHGSFQIQLQPKETTSTGSDKITFLFSANIGQTPKELEFTASGGELSRLLLSFQTALSQKNGSNTLVFDEIDSNIGGKTASLIGEKLHSLGKYSQIISVTHFVQVATWASSHFRVYKKEESGRMLTRIEKLTETEKKKEYARMIGK